MSKMKVYVVTVFHEDDQVEFMVYDDASVTEASWLDVDDVFHWVTKRVKGRRKLYNASSLAKLVAWLTKKDAVIAGETSGQSY